MGRKLKISDVSRYLDVISEPNRLSILELLKGGAKCACEVHPALKLPQNLSSHHLKILKETGLVKSRREGTKIIYSRAEKTICRCQDALTRKLTKKSS